MIRGEDVGGSEGFEMTHPDSGTRSALPSVSLRPEVDLEAQPVVSSEGAISISPHHLKHAILTRH